jgi:hypothetical protein
MVKKRLTRLISFPGLLLLLLSNTVYATEQLPSQLTSEKVALTRCSEAELKAFRWIHVGYAAVYLQSCDGLNDIFSETPKRLRFVYEKSIPANAFKEASEEYLKLNLGQQFENWRGSFAEFNQGYRDIKDGDYYDLIYTPKQGLSLFLNDTLMTKLDDPEKGLAYFNIWFGKEPFSTDLKRALLSPQKL